MVMEQNNTTTTTTTNNMTTETEAETATLTTAADTGTITTTPAAAVTTTTAPTPTTTATTTATTPENNSSKRSYGHWSHERDKAYVTAAIKYFKGSSPEHAKWTDIQDTVNKVQPDLGKLALSTVKNRKKELLDAHHKRTEGLSIHTSAESTELDKLITELIEVMHTASQKAKKDGEEKGKNHQEQEHVSEEGTNTEEDVKEKDPNNSCSNNNRTSSTAGERRSRPLDKEDETTVVKRPRSIQPAYREPPQCRMKLPPPPPLPTTTATTPPPPPPPHQTQIITTDRNIQLDTLNIMHQQAATLVRIENLLLRMVNRIEMNGSMAMTAPGVINGGNNNSSNVHPASPAMHPSQQNSSTNPPNLSSMSTRHIAPMPTNPPPLNIRPFIPPEASSQGKSKK